MKTILPVLLVCLNVLFVTGCGTYRLAEVDVVTDLNIPPEVTTVQNIASRIAKSRNVVINYSTEYYESKKKSNNSKGMWITEMEREFVNKNFRVLSRQKYNELIREKGVSSSSEVANLLGADLIVQINSLAYSDAIDVSDRTKEKYSIFVSNSSGTKLERSKDLEKNQSVLSTTRSLIRKNLDNKALMVLMDCKVIDTKTGELILFYRNQIFQLKSGRKTSGLITYLLKYEDKSWKLINSTGIKSGSNKNSGNEEVNSSKLINAKIQLIRRVGPDLVEKLDNYRRAGKNRDF